VMLAGGAAAGEPMKPSAVGGLIMSADDKEFFPAAASGGMLEVDASKLALERSQNPATKTFAEKMVSDHTAAAAELKELATKKGITLPTALMDRHQKMLDELKDEETPKEFDEAYKRVMLVSHKEAVTLFGKVAKDSKDPETKAWAAKTLPKLEAHGGLAKDLPSD
jgi:putative membrane protein